MASTDSELVTAWRMNNAANLFLLGSVPRGGLDDRYAARTRTVAGQFAHMHDVRLRWLSVAAPRFACKATPLAKDAALTKATLKAALRASERSMAAYLEACVAAGSVKSWKGAPATFLGYLVAHEAHHRGLAMVAMRIAGRKIPQEVVYGQWDWGKRSSRRPS